MALRHVLFRREELKKVLVAAVAVFCITFGILLAAWLAATLIYSTAYMVTVPIAHQSWPLYFNFDARRPTAYVYFEERLQKGQVYEFEIELRLPYSQRNRDAGMFMVSMLTGPSQSSLRLADSPLNQPQVIKRETRFHSASDSALGPDPLLSTTGRIPEDLRHQTTGVSRPAHLPYTSTLVLIFRRFFFWFPYLFGFWTEEATISVPLHTNVRVGDKGVVWGGLSLSSNQLEISSATLKAHAHMQGASYFLYNWFLSSFVLGTSLLTFLFASAMYFVVFLLRDVIRQALEIDHIWQTLVGGEEDLAEDQGDGNGEEDADSFPRMGAICDDGASTHASRASEPSRDHHSSSDSNNSNDKGEELGDRKRRNKTKHHDVAVLDLPSPSSSSSCASSSRASSPTPSPGHASKDESEGMKPASHLRKRHPQLQENRAVVPPSLRQRELDNTSSRPTPSLQIAPISASLQEAMAASDSSCEESTEHDAMTA